LVRVRKLLPVHRSSLSDVIGITPRSERSVIRL